ncbi:MAG: hypothetical protein ABI782_06240 [Anaerolineaceae bacterium]
MSGTFRMLVPVFVGLCALLAVGAARADGEAGIVIQHGNGAVDTYCVPFKGDSINGADLLKKVSIPVVRLGDLVCAVGNNPAEGCFAASDYDSCTCKCSGANAATCTYWAYFSQTYAQAWVYSGLSFALLKSKDGDMQAWRWGPGGASSAPPPPALSFEAVCGHAPRGGLAQITQSPASTPTIAAAAGTNGASLTIAQVPTALVTLTETATRAVISGTAEPSRTVSVTITAHGIATATPAPAIAASTGEEGGSKGGLLLFSAFAVVMLATIGGALVWRRTHGA